jgi:hypothetical protein
MDALPREPGREQVPIREGCGRPSPEGGPSLAHHPAQRRGFATTPTFAVMALCAAIRNGSVPDKMCIAVHGTSPLGGMVPMSLLMSAFHSTPWLRLFSRQAGDGQRSPQMTS